MLRSLDYAAHAIAFRRPESERAAALVALTAWEARARDAFLAGYLDAVTESPVPLVPATAEALRSAVAPFELQKAAYELRYELDNRPDWVAIPLAGIRRILDAESADDLNRSSSGCRAPSAAMHTANTGTRLVTSTRAPSVVVIARVKPATNPNVARAATGSTISICQRSWSSHDA